MKHKYQFGDQTIELELDESVVAVRFREPAPHSMRAAVAVAAGTTAFESRFEVPKEKFTLLRTGSQPGTAPANYTATTKKLNASDNVTRVAPVFRCGSRRVVATDRLLLGFDGPAAAFKTMLKKHKATVLRSTGGEHLVQLEADVDPFGAAAKMSKEKAVTYVEPDFVTIGRHIARPPAAATPGPANDPMLGQQYAMHLTKAVEAWGLQGGSPAIKIAILDEGVDRQHEDLGAAIVGSYDASDGDEFQQPNDWDGHGTACAGLAAAIPSNAKGIRGVGGGCSLLAVRIAYSDAPNAGWVTSNSWIQASVDWAWQNGAAVLSNSWGGGAPSQAIINAFTRARQQGRGGKGAVVVIAAGNEAGAVSFPGNLSDMVTVSASNERDEFKTKTSSDGETWWGSNFGPEVDIAAPGVHNLTTDIMGTVGYSTNNYTPTFNGTSSATPLVAGAAGLILSANPNLTEAQVREILKNSADKVGALPYVAGRNNQMGYGRLNVLRAIQAAKEGGSEPLSGKILPLVKPLLDFGAAFFLETVVGTRYLLRNFVGMEALSWEALEERSLRYFASYAGKAVVVSYAREQKTQYGSILWGARVVNTTNPAPPVPRRAGRLRAPAGGGGGGIGIASRVKQILASMSALAILDERTMGQLGLEPHEVQNRMNTEFFSATNKRLTTEQCGLDVMVITLISEIRDLLAS